MVTSPQHLLAAVDVIGDGVDIQFLENVLRDAGGAIG